MPAPMNPAPSIAMRSTGRATAVGSSTPGSFFSALVAKNSSTSRAEVSLTTSSPKARASTSREAAIPPLAWASSTSRIRSTAG